MAQDSTSTSAIGGIQGPLVPNTNNPATKEASNPLTLQIDNTVGKIMNHIPKGAFKKDSNNPNVRATQNYSIMENLAKRLVQCLLWRFSRVSPHRENLCYLPWE
jgi:hypothetical protein